MGGIIRKIKNLNKALRYLRFDLPQQIAELKQANADAKDNVNRLQEQILLI